MNNVEWDDLSEFNDGLWSTYPWPVVAIRSNDGTYRDKHFHQNLAVAKHLADTNHVAFFTVYFVYETNWKASADTFLSQIGVPHVKMTVEIDLEHWAPPHPVISGDQSKNINACRTYIVKRLRRQLRTRVSTRLRRVFTPIRRRVTGYANQPDFTTLWVHRPRKMWTHLANYNGPATFPMMYAQQVTSSFPEPGHGTVDHNIARNITPQQLARKLGVW